jgi:hypothetical protein
LDIAWPQQAPIKGVDNPKTSQDTIKVKVEVMVERLFLSSLTYRRTQVLSPYFARISFTCKAMVLPNVSIVPKNSNSYLKKLSFIIQKMHNKHKSINTSP